MTDVAIFWHRRDLRIEDNAGLYKALKSGLKVQPIFVFDKNILEELPELDQRVIFIHQEIKRLKREYAAVNCDFKVFYGTPETIFEQLVGGEEFSISKVFTNRDYEPYALERDKKIHTLLKVKDIEFIGAKDHVVFEKDEILKDDGTPYKVFTPYMRKFKLKLTDYHLKSYCNSDYFENLFDSAIELPVPSLIEMGFSGNQTQDFPLRDFPKDIISSYDETRDFPAVLGTSRLGIHLRFGTISIRELSRSAQKWNEKYFNELIWREFYQMIMYHFPHTVSRSFKPAYDVIPWENNEVHFEAWCKGQTGYPMVDAGMRELNETGFMHNRVRMIVGSFLTKHLLTDWRRGEAYFAEKLLDFDLASNVGGWQWAASSGVDAQPYFRVFNPESQLNKFDKEEKYIRKWIPEFGTAKYPEPIIEHKFGRERAIRVFKEALSSEK